MATFYSFNGYTPVVDKSAFVHPDATIIGDVVIGKNVYIGPGARIRGDWGGIVIEDGCNVQENCIIHMFPGVTVYLRKSAHVGHGAIIHGATLGKNTLIGMNAVIMDGAIIGDGSIVGALTFIRSEMNVPERKVVAGNPGRIIKDVTDEMLEWKKQGTELYQGLPEECFQGLYQVDPLSEIEKNRKVHDSTFKPWKGV